MKALLFLGLILLAAASAAEVTEEADVIVLTDDNFDQVIKDNQYVLVKFYAPWCGHCKKLAPEWEKAAKVLKVAEKPVVLAKLDCTVHKQASSKFEIKGFPTLKFFTAGNVIDFTGGRTEQEIITWAQKRTGDVSTLLTDQAAVDSFLSQNRLATIYFTDSVTGPNWDVFTALAMGYDKIGFAHVTDSSLAQDNKAKLGQISFFKDFDEKRNDYEGEFTNAALKAWLEEKKVAIVMEFDDTAIEVVFQKGIPTIFIFHNETEESKAAREIFNSVAQELQGGQVKFSYVVPSNQHWQRLADYIGVNTAVVPSIMLVRSAGEVQKYKFESELTAANLKQFLQDFSDRKLTQYIKSEDIPASNDQPVKVIVGKQFDELVINNGKDVLVKFYAPWCGHCKKIIPAWEEAASKLQVNPNIVIAKCDSTANEIPGVEVKSFPTIKFWSGKNKSKQVDFNGDRTTEGIIKFLRENSSNPWVPLEGEEQEKRDDL